MQRIDAYSRLQYNTINTVFNLVYDMYIPILLLLALPGLEPVPGLSGGRAPSTHRDGWEAQIEGVHNILLGQMVKHG
jgi:hypothetical protein